MLQIASNILICKTKRAAERNNLLSFTCLETRTKCLGQDSMCSELLGRRQSRRRLPSLVKTSSPEPRRMSSWKRSQERHGSLKRLALFLRRALEVLHGSFVLLSPFLRLECPKVLTFPGLWILLARIQTVLPRFQFSDHRLPPMWRIYSVARARVTWRSAANLDLGA